MRNVSSYDRIACHYTAEFSGELRPKPLDRALFDVVAELAAGGTVADVGCGPGQAAAYLTTVTPPPWRHAFGWEPEPGRFHLFSVDIRDLVFIRYDDATGDQFRVAWPPGREFVRRGTSATSLGLPEPRRELLFPD